ncbi:PR domain zinc finger protein 5-like [Chironomus tepperi]|uniref:PR domain zinc finger protein 5-like n=1 Tax=Chironomus tepperi TaxID=113505 RepID=UPI00391F388A
MEENKCVIKSCGSITNNLFCSPSDDEILKKWQQITETTESSFFVCDNHFSSKDIVIERYLEPLAVPTLDITHDIDNVEADTCGICLEKLKEEKIQLSKQNSDNFKAVTGYEPVKDQICESCCQFLQTYQKFKTEIKEKHKKLRFKEVQNDESDDDCVVVVSESADKPSDRSKLPKIVKLPASIISSVKKLDDGKGIKTLFRCKHCYFKTNERNALIEHIDDNHYYPCRQCPFISSNKPLLTLHVNKFHSTDKTSIICGICDKVFKDKDEIDGHYESKHDEQTCSYFMCFYCKTNCKTGLELRYHYDQFHSTGLTTAQQQINNTKLQLALLIGRKERKTDASKEKSYNEIMDRIKNVVTVKKVANKKKKRKVSSSCPLPLNTPIYIGQSMNPKPQKPGPKITEVTIVNNSKNFLSEIPDPISSSEEEIEAVIADITDTISLDSDSDDDVPLKKIAKEITPEKPKDIKDVLKNRVQTIKDGTKQLEKSKKDIDQHLKYVFRCFTCDEYYDDVTKLLKHREEVHPPSETLKNYQPFDMTKIPAPDPRKYERKKPDSNAKVACPICSFIVQENNLERHKQRVHAEKQYLCHVCSKAFGDPSAFKYHVMKHEPETMYQCDMCDKGWVTKGLLAKHIKRTHLKIPSVRDVCTICKKKLYRSMKHTNVLEIHMKKYHPDGKDDGYRVNEETNFYDCEKCGASYWDLYTFIRHSCDKGRNQIRCLDCMTPCGSLETLAKHKVTRCRKINPFTNSVGLKDLAATKERINNNPQYKKILQQEQNYQQQQQQNHAYQHNSQVQHQAPQMQPQTSHVQPQSSQIQIQSQQLFHFHPQYQPQFFTNFQN